MDPHPLLRWGPMLFVMGSLLACGWLSKRTFRALQLLRVRRIDRARLGTGPVTRGLARVERGPVSFYGVLLSPEVADGSLALDQPVRTDRASRVVPDLAMQVGDLTFTLEGAIDLADGTDELAIEDERFRRAYVGDRLYCQAALHRGPDGERVLRGTGESGIVLHDGSIPPLRSPLTARSTALVLTVALTWAGATALAFTLLALPLATSGASGSLPGARLDAWVVAHAVPPASRAAKERMVVALDELTQGRRRFDGARIDDAVILASTLDPDLGRAARRFAEKDFRARAGAFAHAKPGEATCPAGLDALAESLRGGPLQTLMADCAGAKGDATLRAAFKMGDFMRAGGREVESIISRLPMEPDGEPACAAGGYEFPPESEPLCRLVHAEMRGAFKRKLTAGELPRALARRWKNAMLAELGEPFDLAHAFTLDPWQYLQDPMLAVLDEPIAVYRDLRMSTQATLTPAVAAWVRLAVAAELSAAGRHADARVLADEAELQLSIGAGATEEEREAVARLVFVIFLRAGDAARVEAARELLPVDDPLQLVPSDRRAPFTDLPTGIDETWLREGFPSCEGCGFFDQLVHHTRRRDLAELIGAEELLADLDPVVRRFEAVIHNRLLGLSLRLADPRSAR
jgi:hypothetical protein